MQTETQEKSSATHEEDQIEELRQSIYDELKTFIKTDGKTECDRVQKEVRKQTDPLSKILTEYVDKNTETEEEYEKTWQHIAFAIVSYLSFEIIQKKILTKDFVEKVLNELIR